MEYYKNKIVEEINIFYLNLYTNYCVEAAVCFKNWVKNSAILIVLVQNEVSPQEDS